MLCKEISWPQENAVWSNNNWKIFFTLFNNQTIQNGWSKLYAKFVSGTLKENCCQKTFTYFQVIEGHSFSKHSFNYFNKNLNLYFYRSKTILEAFKLLETGPNCLGQNRTLVKKYNWIRKPWFENPDPNPRVHTIRGYWMS